MEEGETFCNATLKLISENHAEVRRPGGGAAPHYDGPGCPHQVGMWPGQWHRPEWLVQQRGGRMAAGWRWEGRMEASHVRCASLLPLVSPAVLPAYPLRRALMASSRLPTATQAATACARL